MCTHTTYERVYVHTCVRFVYVCVCRTVVSRCMYGMYVKTLLEYRYQKVFQSSKFLNRGFLSDWKRQNYCDGILKFFILKDVC